MREDRADPESCLRSLTAEALLWAHPQRPLFPVSLGVMAMANAFVMLGLLPEPLAETILAEHRSALLAWEPVSGFEPLTCRLQDGCSAN
jgi:hypothetical protein